MLTLPETFHRVHECIVILHYSKIFQKTLALSVADPPRRTAIGSVVP
jgi:hypothetical protein